MPRDIWTRRGWEGDGPDQGREKGYRKPPGKKESQGLLVHADV